MVDNQFEANWARTGLEPCSRPTTTLVRRLSLGLTGTIPSLEEIRELEKQPEGTRVQWWLSHLFEDRRTSDHLAEAARPRWRGGVSHLPAAAVC